MTLVPLGDQAALAYFDDECLAWRFAVAVRQANDPWLIDVVHAYSSVAVFFNLDKTGFARVAERAREQLAQMPIDAESRLHRVPCCYELGLDLKRIAQHTRLSADQVIRLHTEAVYTVCAIGFCPGFPYLGYLPDSLCGVPRLESPRLRVEAGSVGLTGRQTGIYTEARPGGWNLVGKTPLELVNVADNYFPLRTGDRVQFVHIDAAEFRRLQGQRL